MSQLTEKQTRLMARLLHRVLIEIGGVGCAGQSSASCGFGGRFPQSTVYMFSENFSWTILRQFVTEYQDQYPPPKECGPCDYLTILEGIEQRYDDVEMF